MVTGRMGYNPVYLIQAPIFTIEIEIKKSEFFLYRTTQFILYGFTQILPQPLIRHGMIFWV